LHFRIDKNPSFTVQGEKRTQFLYTNENGDQILYLRLTAVYQLYNKEATTREGIDVIGISTIRNYFHSCKEFIGLIKGKRFGKAGSQSCYAFNYTMMRNKGLLNLIEDNSVYTKETGEMSSPEAVIPNTTITPSKATTETPLKETPDKPDELPF
jgi:hypothetical protein